MSGTGESGESGGTPPPHFLKTNTGGAIRRRRGGQPGNRNAVKNGQHTAEMRSLRADVRIAVQKAKALAAAAWIVDVPSNLTLSSPASASGSSREGRGPRCPSDTDA
jgi:hypothetical protein